MRRLLLVAALLTVGSCTSSVAPSTSSGGSTSPASTDPTSTTAADTSTTIVAATSVDNSDLTCWTADVSGEIGEITFTDATAESGLVDPLVGLHGHAALWTDIDSDGRPDIFVGTFADRPDERYEHRGATGPSPDRMLMQTDGFSPLPGFPDMFTRTSGGATADLDGDGDLDMVLSRNFRDHVADEATTQILRNDDGQLSPVGSTGLPEQIGGRSVAIFDQDLDGQLDMFITEDRWSGGSSVLLRNLGDLRFEDVTSRSGIPDDVHGLGVAAADFNNDRLLDLIVTGSNRLFIATSEGTFVEADSTVFEWEIYGNEDDVAGVSVADLNRDGWLDIVVGHHFNSTIDHDARVPVRVYLNLGAGDGGFPEFKDVTDATGLPSLATKAPHVELADFDNDGWVDLITSASTANGSEPALFRHTGLDDGVPQFEITSPLGSPQYWVAAPTADFDLDGRVDVFLLEWEPARPSILLSNQTQSGNWLEVSVGSEYGNGLGWRVSVFEGGELIGSREITVTQGYSAGVLPIAHFGVGEADELSVILEPPGTGQPIGLDRLKPNQHLRYPTGCGD